MLTELEKFLVHFIFDRCTSNDTRDLGDGEQTDVLVCDECDEFAEYPEGEIEHRKDCSVGEVLKLAQEKEKE